MCVRGAWGISSRADVGDSVTEGRRQQVLFNTSMTGLNWWKRKWIVPLFGWFCCFRPLKVEQPKQRYFLDLLHPISLQIPFLWQVLFQVDVTGCQVVVLVLIACWTFNFQLWKSITFSKKYQITFEQHFKIKWQNFIQIRSMRELFIFMQRPRHFSLPSNEGLRLALVEHLSFLWCEIKKIEWRPEKEKEVRALYQ